MVKILGVSGAGQLVCSVFQAFGPESPAFPRLPPSRVPGIVPATFPPLPPCLIPSLEPPLIWPAGSLVEPRRGRPEVSHAHA